MNINSDTALMRGVRTAIQAMIGVLVGLAGVIWSVPGVPDAVSAYTQQNVVPMLLAVGIPSGIAGFVWNLLRRDVRNV